MGKSQKLFRYLWRINAVLILVAAGAITFGVGALVVTEFGARSARSRDADAGVPVAADSKIKLSLGNASAVPGTNVLRANLSLERGGAGFSSGGYTETRNILFIEPGQKAARWLLPDNDHLIAHSSDIPERSGIDEDKAGNARNMIATAVLVKTAIGGSEPSTGKLLLFDPSGRKIVEVADGVREIHNASLYSGELTILYERNRRLVLAAFDPASLSSARNRRSIFHNSNRAESCMSAHRLCSVAAMHGGRTRVSAPHKQKRDKIRWPTRATPDPLGAERAPSPLR